MVLKFGAVFSYFIAAPLQTLVAAYKVHHAADEGTMKTKIVFAETINCLSNSRKVGYSISCEHVWMRMCVCACVCVDPAPDT